ncbi:MAG: MFS transporter [Gammaproteobacteria bacterium]|nr:MFS transporter [Gammaproteobacteria bacterium]
MLIRNVFLLATCQALMMTSMSLIGTVSGLVGYALADDKALATLPHALQFAGMMSITFPASMLMGRVGRQYGFLLGATFAIVGASLAAVAISNENFWLFCFASALVGCSTAFGQYYRFAAADVAPLEFRARAISLVLSGGVVAAFAGPNLAGFTQFMMADTAFVGGYVAVVLLSCLSFLVLLFVRIPKVEPKSTDGPARPLSDIVRRPTYATAVLCAVIAYTTMALVMTATPLAMRAKGLPFHDTVLVIQWHIVGMYGPAFFTGHLIKRFGVITIMMSGALLSALCAIVNLVNDTTAYIWTALFLIGVGWNFLFTGATTLLTETYTEAEKSKAQGFNDLLLFSGVAFAALMSGTIHHYLGWNVLNATMIVPPIIAFGALVWLRAYRARVEPTPAPARP